MVRSTTEVGKLNAVEPFERAQQHQFNITDGLSLSLLSDLRRYPMLRTRTIIFLGCLSICAGLIFLGIGQQPVALGQSSDDSQIYLPILAGRSATRMITLNQWTDISSMPGWAELTEILEQQNIRPVQETPGRIDLYFLQDEYIEYVVEISPIMADGAEATSLTDELEDEEWQTVVSLFHKREMELDKRSSSLLTLQGSQSDADYQINLECTEPKCEVNAAAKYDMAGKPAPPDHGNGNGGGKGGGRKTSTPTPTVTDTPEPTNTPNPTDTPLPTPTALPQVNKLQIGSGSMNPGNQIDVWVEVTSLQPEKSIGAVNLNIVYDPAVVTPVACQTDLVAQFDLSFCNTADTGIVKLNALNAVGVASTPIKLALITFQAIGSGGQASTLDLQVNTFTDPAGSALETVDVDGLITLNQASNSGLSVGTVSTNLSSYDGGQVPRFEKLELTFNLATVATNLQLPFDASPPQGIEPGIGVSVDALFSPDNWETVYTQPAFYFQDFQYEIKSNQEWFYPSNNFAWKVRFAPNQEGQWQYKIVAKDASGTTESSPQSFSVGASSEKGFIRVSTSDSRYFEYDDGTYFPGLGYNMNYDHVSWKNPVLDNQQNFQSMAQNGIQLVRIWLSQWAIFGSEWNPWMAQDPALHALYLPYTGLTYATAPSGSEASMRMQAQVNPCMYIGDWKGRAAVKRNTDYRVRIHYMTEGITGPRIAGSPFGFVAKTGGWLWDQDNYCKDPGVGTAVTPHQSQATENWQILEGTLNSGNSDFLPNFFLVLDNVTAGKVYIDYVWIEEVLGDGQFGANIVSKPWMSQHLYMEQRNSFAFDKLLELARQNDIYLRPVILEKNDWLFNTIDYDGNPIADDPLCHDQDATNDPARCPSNQWFYGNWREPTKVRWLQQAWWRYLQARWGYSPNIHSWELLNEGDPFNGLHYALADEFGKYMHQFEPNDHLVSTSTWHSFPKDEFLANPDYPNVDFADIHQYIGESDPLFGDTAQATSVLSKQIGAKQASGAGKPVIRGETAFVVSGSGPTSGQILADTEAVWLHNFVWGGINAGGLIESYWYENDHIYRMNSNGTYAFDHRSKFRTYANFIEDLPLNNGYYVDAQATTSHTNLQAWGQKDLNHGCAHLWIQNAQHTWKNIVDGTSITPLSGSVSIAGFQPETNYVVQRWDTYQADKSLQVMDSTTVTSQSNGTIVLSVSALVSDYAVKIVSPTGCR